MRPTRSRALGLLTLGLAVAACGLAGSGNLITEARDVPPFEAVEVSSGINLVLKVVPDGVQAVSVTYDDNLLDNIETEVRGNTLVVDVDGAFNTFGSGRFVSVTATSLTSVTASGGSDLDGSGNAGEYSLDVSGGADVDLRELDARTVDVDISGGADVEVAATESIVGEISGGSDVTVFGSPANSRLDVSGGADVDYDG